MVLAFSIGIVQHVTPHITHSWYQHGHEAGAPRAWMFQGVQSKVGPWRALGVVSSSSQTELGITGKNSILFMNYSYT